MKYSISKWHKSMSFHTNMIKLQIMTTNITKLKRMLNFQEKKNKSSEMVITSQIMMMFSIENLYQSVARNIWRIWKKGLRKGINNTFKTIKEIVPQYLCIKQGSRKIMILPTWKRSQKTFMIKKISKGKMNPTSKDGFMYVGIKETWSKQIRKI